MSHIRPSYRVPTAETFVRAALKRVGRSERTYGYWWHSIIGYLYLVWDRLLGSDFNSRLAYWILFSYRQKYYRAKKIEDPFFGKEGENKFSLFTEKVEVEQTKTKKL